MKALLCTQFGPPELLEYRDVPAPVAGRGQVVVSVKAASVNFPDVLIIENKYQFKPPLPFSPGSELAGVVKEVGAGRHACQAGRSRHGVHDLRRVCRGGHARREPRAADARRHGLPDGGGAAPDLRDDGPRAARSRARASRARPCWCSARRRHRHRVDRDRQGAAARASSPARRATRSSPSAASTAPTRRSTTRREDLRERIKALTDGRGVDVIVDPVGGPVHRTGAALDRLARPSARRRICGRRDPEDSAQSGAAQGLRDRRRVLGRLPAPRAAGVCRQRRAAGGVVCRGEAAAAHLGDVPARARAPMRSATQ